jgi:signal recognition particle subunit SRP54
MGMVPGARKAKEAMANANLDDRVLKRQEAIILSMTKAERRKPALLNASRRKRIAAGAGVDVSDVNKLLKMHLQMSTMMKKMRTKGGMKGMLGAAQAAGLSPADLAKMGSGGMPGGLPGLGGPSAGGLPGGLPGLGGGSLPGLGGTKKK